MRFKINVKAGDFAPTSQTMTDKGLLCKDAVFAIAPQVREYLPSELGMKAWKHKTVKLFTPADSLFSDDVISRLEGGDFVEGHPLGNVVTPKNWRQHSIGSASNVRRDGDRLIGDLLVKDEAAIKAIQSKKKTELSLGYELFAEQRSGKTDSGESYDMVITKMIGDHVALVKQGRGGREVRIGDKKLESKMRKIKLASGLTFEVEGENLDAFEQSIEAQNAELTALKEKAEGEITIGEKTFKVSDTVAIQAAFDAITKQKVDAETKATELEANAIKPEDVEKLATERSNVVSEAKGLKDDIDANGKTVEAIKSEAVEAHAGDAAVKAILGGISIGDAKPEQIATAFNVLVATKPAGKVKANAGDSNAAADALKNLNTPASVNPLDIINEAKSQMYKDGE